MDSMINQEPGAHPVFPPDVDIQIKALACELPARQGIPLSRFSCYDLATAAVERATIIAFQNRYEQTAKPFEWKFTKHDLEKIMRRLDSTFSRVPLAA